MKRSTMYHYKESGLRNVWLVNGFSYEETPYGRALSVQNVHALHREIAAYIIEKPSTLSGAEVRFLRKEMELSQAALGELLGVSAQSIALWEKSRSRITPPSDRLLRLLICGFHQGEVNVREVIDRLNDSDRQVAEARVCFAQRRKGWALQVA